MVRVVHGMYPPYKIRRACTDFVSLLKSFKTYEQREHGGDPTNYTRGVRSGWRSKLA